MMRRLTTGAFWLGCVVAAAAFAPRCDAADAYQADPFRLRYYPRVHHYDAKADKFYHFKSVTVPNPGDSAGDDLTYYGNRLTQFRFTGRPERSGIYGAMDKYKSQLKLEPQRYQYRWQLHGP